MQIHLPHVRLLHVDQRYEVYWKSVAPPHPSATFKAPAKTFYKPPPQRAVLSDFAAPGSPRAPRERKPKIEDINPEHIWNPAVDMPMGVPLGSSGHPEPGEGGVVAEGNVDVERPAMLLEQHSTYEGVVVHSTTARDHDDVELIGSSSDDGGSPLPQVSMSQDVREGSAKGTTPSNSQIEVIDLISPDVSPAAGVASARAVSNSPGKWVIRHGTIKLEASDTTELKWEGADAEEVVSVVEATTAEVMVTDEITSEEPLQTTTTHLSVFAAAATIAVVGVDKDALDQTNDGHDDDKRMRSDVAGDSMEVCGDADATARDARGDLDDNDDDDADGDGDGSDTDRDDDDDNQAGDDDDDIADDAPESWAAMDEEEGAAAGDVAEPWDAMDDDSGGRRQSRSRKWLFNLDSSSSDSDSDDDDGIDNDDDNEDDDDDDNENEGDTIYLAAFTYLCTLLCLS